MRIYLTDDRSAFRREDVLFAVDERAERDVLACFPRRTYQRIAGFGGAFTEAGAYVFAQMPPDVQDEFMHQCFGGAGDAPAAGGDPARGGNGYTLCRTHIQSCDFALGNYAYVRPFDRALRSFTIDRDRQLLLPFIQCALAANPSLELLASPWSPPAFMKTNRLMNLGGRLRPSQYGAWARVLARYVGAYADAGVRIGRMTVQNEPQARQTWDSCLFTAQEEAEFATRHLRPALDAAGFGELRLLAWDHNTDRLLDRAEAAFEQSGAREAFDGVAFHWYAGDHFEQVRAVAEEFPEKELLFTEGCVEYSHADARHATQQRKAEQYAHALIGHLNAGAAGFIDWNLLLDERGGPNHVGNFCEAPLMYDRERRELMVNRSFHYLGHVTRFVAPGARRFLVSRPDDRVECAGFVSPDGVRVLVALNRTDAAAHLKVAERPYVAQVEVPAHAIATCIWEAAEFSLRRMTSA